MKGINSGLCSEFSCCYYDKSTRTCKYKKEASRCTAIGNYENCPYNIGTSYCKACKTVSCNHKLCFLDGYKTIDVGQDELLDELPSPFEEEPKVASAYIYGTFNQVTKVYGYGGVLIIDDDVQEFSKAGSDTETASMHQIGGELLAACTAILMAKRHDVKNLKLFYKYEGVENWATGKWQAKNNKTKSYVDFIKKCGLNLSFEKAKPTPGLGYYSKSHYLAKKAAGIN